MRTHRLAKQETHSSKFNATWEGQSPSLRSCSEVSSSFPKSLSRLLNRLCLVGALRQSANKQRGTASPQLTLPPQFSASWGRRACERRVVRQLPHYCRPVAGHTPVWAELPVLLSCSADLRFRGAAGCSNSQAGFCHGCSHMARRRTILGLGLWLRVGGWRGSDMRAWRWPACAPGRRT